MQLLLLYGFLDDPTACARRSFAIDALLSHCISKAFPPALDVFWICREPAAVDSATFHGDMTVRLLRPWIVLRRMQNERIFVVRSELHSCEIPHR
jgi:hypothetical protein